MTIGSITPSSALLASIASSGTGASQGDVTGSLFTKLLAEELEEVAEQLSGAAATPAEVTGTAAHAVSFTTASTGATASTTTTHATTTTTEGATAGAASVSPATQSPATPTTGHDYVVSYVHGATPVSTGPTPAPLVVGATGKLRLTAKTTGLTQLTPRFTGTVADPTAEAKATASVMAQIDALVAEGQA